MPAGLLGRFTQPSCCGQAQQHRAGANPGSVRPPETSLAAQKQTHTVLSAVSLEPELALGEHSAGRKPGELRLIGEKLNKHTEDMLPLLEGICSKEEPPGPRTQLDGLC